MTADNTPILLFDGVRFSDQTIPIPVMGLPVAVLMAVLILLVGLTFGRSWPSSASRR